MLQEFQALVNRKKHLESVRGVNSLLENGISFRGTKIEDLCLDFNLPGYPHIFLAQGPHHSIVRHCLIYIYITLIFFFHLEFKLQTLIYLSFFGR